MEYILYFDLVDPTSRQVCDMIDQAGIAEAIDWRGLELCPPPEPMIDPTAPEWQARHAGGAPPPPLVPWTRKAHELCEFARGRDCFHAVRRALLRAHFIDHTDIGRIDLLVEIARRAGLDRSETRAALDVDHHTAAVLRNRERALKGGVRDIPALIWRDGRLEGPAILRQIQRLIRTKRVNDGEE